MSFHEVRFPASLSFGSVGGPERRTEIVALSNGFEERNTPWAHSRRRFDAGLGMRSLDDLSELIGFFEARKGQLYGFRWKDWTDYKSCTLAQDPAPTDQIIGYGNGIETAFQLVKTYRSGDHTYTRPVVKPVDGTVRIAIDGVEVTGPEAFFADRATGVVTFTDPPADTAEITAGYEYDIPVRFDTDRIDASVSRFQAGEVPSVPVVEVRV